MVNPKIKLVAVSYLNTKPLLAGLRQSPLADKLEIIEANTGDCADQLTNGAADIALIPVAAIPAIPNARIISNYCIGASGKVDSVCLFSEVPIEEVETILLDYQSRTSVELCQLLINKYWQRDVRFENTEPGYIDQIKGKKAGLVIGDRTFDLKSKMPYRYDLAEIWMEYTGLPFVFACWISRIDLTPDFIQSFDAALGFGLGQRAELAASLQPNFAGQDVHDYFMNKIDYKLNETKRLGLNRFYEELDLGFEPTYYLPGERVAR